MKRSFSRLITIAAQSWAATVARVRCNAHRTDAGKPPRCSVQWTGEDSGYESTTAVAKEPPRAPQQQSEP